MNNARRDGLLLAASAAVGMAIMNSPWSGAFQQWLELPVQVGVGSYVLNKPLELWINDFLMAIFFLLVGVEIKHEWLHGALSTPQARVLPFGAALGGMALPALIFVGINWSQPVNLAGWAIPAATDIAFAIGLMAIAAPGTRAVLLAFLTAVAVLDDLGAIIVIALFYSTHLIGWALGGAIATFVVMLMMNRGGVTALWLYWLLGLVMWGFMLISGVHATIAGVLTAMTVPMRNAAGGSPLIAAEHALKYWVQFAIMPIFALVNAGVVLRGAGLETLLHPIASGVALGLIAGKPLGIMLATYLACLVIKQRAPATAPQMLGIAMLAGIGFTMSLFIGNLAFGMSDLATPVRFGVLGGSFASALLGLIVLWFATRNAHPAPSALTQEEELAAKHGVFEER